MSDRFFKEALRLSLAQDLPLAGNIADNLAMGRLGWKRWYLFSGVGVASLGLLLFFTNCARTPGLLTAESSLACEGSNCALVSGAHQSSLRLTVNSVIPTLRTGENSVSLSGVCTPGLGEFSRVRYSLRHVDHQRGMWHMLFLNDSYEPGAPVPSPRYQYWRNDGVCENGVLHLQIPRVVARVRADPESSSIDGINSCSGAGSEISCENLVGIDLPNFGRSSECETLTNPSKWGACSLDARSELLYQLTVQIQTSTRDPRTAGFRESEWIDGSRFLASVKMQYPAIGLGAGPYDVIPRDIATPEQNAAGRGGHAIVRASGGVLDQINPSYTFLYLGADLVDPANLNGVGLPGACLLDPTSTETCCPSQWFPAAGVRAKAYRLSPGEMVVCAGTGYQYDDGLCAQGSVPAQVSIARSVVLAAQDAAGNRSFLTMASLFPACRTP